MIETLAPTIWCCWLKMVEHGIETNPKEKKLKKVTWLLFIKNVNSSTH
jgi:hypothetical protein